jgi:hypothetical protein
MPSVGFKPTLHGPILLCYQNNQRGYGERCVTLKATLRPNKISLRVKIRHQKQFNEHTNNNARRTEQDENNIE